jgi:hypothetical protein
MNTFSRQIVSGLCLLGVAAAGLRAADEPAAAERAALPTPRPMVQMAILLDTSGSMDGLIDQARTQIWKLVNDFAKSKRAGQTPILQVALYHYGNNGLPRDKGHVGQLVPLSTDLDRISEELFKLRTNGGEEYCGWAIKTAVEELKWSDRKGDLKVIFIAGNEPFSQGPVDFRTACKAAIAKGIIVNTIHCGPADIGEATGWKEGADLADGRYMTIDQNRQVVRIAAPQDKEIAELGAKLNTTYVAFGAAGKEARERQEKADKAAAAAAPEVNAQRQLAKAGEQYRNSAWDLIDALKEKTVKLEELKDEQLPEELRTINPEDRAKWLADKQKEREELQARIKKLADEREKFVAEERKKQAAGGADTLDAAMIKAVREQATKNGFEYKE